MFQIKKFIQAVWHEILYNGHLQCLSSVGVAVLSCQLFNLKIDFIALTIIYLSFYLIYLYNRYQEREIDALTNKARVEHLKKIEKFLPLISWAVLLVLAFLLIKFTNLATIIYTVLVTIFGMLYTTYFKGLTKKIVMFKNFYVAGVFSLLLFFPFIYLNLKIENLLALTIIALFIFLEGVVMQIFLDLKDVDGDKTIGLKTLGVLIGKEKAVLISYLSSFLIGLILFIIYFIHPIFPKATLLLLLVVPFDFLCFTLVYKKNNFWGYILIGAEFAVWPVLVWLGQFLIK